MADVPHTAAAEVMPPAAVAVEEFNLLEKLDRQQGGWAVGRLWN